MVKRLECRLSKRKCRLYTWKGICAWLSSCPDCNMPTQLCLLKRRESPMPFEVMSHACFMKTSQTKGWGCFYPTQCTCMNTNSKLWPRAQFLVKSQSCYQHDFVTFSESVDKGVNQSLGVHKPWGMWQQSIREATITLNFLWSTLHNPYFRSYHILCVILTQNMIISEYICLMFTCTIEASLELCEKSV